MAELDLDAVTTNQASVVTMRERWADRVGPSHHVAADLQQALVRSQRDVPALVAEVRRLREELAQFDSEAEYGLLVAGSVLVVSPEVADAEEMLQHIPGSILVRRKLHVRGWQPYDPESES
ncbi:hypothetical protein [Frigoribacterium sp. PhB24]|uniref:hypothetical protein n=1 Tax=Frigoribacterium sp. PhB24 TaxID=2485204 RepID=UPI000FC351BC|nr:hypothetical protein [Frigoribacterium sp. PhB24]ROS52954.1 hypothetical protein EDF50_1431 [Frigoribacterium sp. PhB24]